MKLWPKTGASRARWLRWALIIYLVTLIASHAWQRRERESPDEPSADRAPPGAETRSLAIVARDDDGPVEGRSCRVNLIHWKPTANGASEPVAVVMFHGSPGDAHNFDDLGPELAARGYDAWAIDLPGFGHTTGDVPSYSILAHARTALAALDELGIERAHLVAWSMGGGVVLHMADLAPERVASLSLLAAIGVQEGEGSGNYYFEHLKYAGLYGVLMVVPELLPHFGWIGGERGRHSFVRNFWDSDQRPLRGILERTHVPTLILHGRSDFLVPLWTARESHRLVSASRLAIFAGSHFLPIGGDYGNLPATLEELTPFFARHAQRGESEPRELVDRTPERVGIQRLDLEPYWLALTLPWWLQFVVLAFAASKARMSAAAIAGAMLAALQLDTGLALIAVALGAALASGPLRARLVHVGTALGVLVTSGIAGAFAVNASGGVLPRGLAIGLIVVAVVIALVLSRRRRQAQVARRLVRMVR